MNFNNSIKPNCAVLLAAYNGMEYIEEQIQSILEQTNVDVTIFVSVDASSDGTEDWIDNLSKQDLRVKVLPHGKKFGGAAKNFFRLIREVEFSSFDFAAFSDQDDIWNLNKLSNAIQILSNADYEAYSSNVIAFWPDGKQLLIEKAKPQKRWDFIFEAAGPGCTYVIKQSLMHAIKQRILENEERVNQVALHDWYCYAFARGNGYNWYIDPIPSMLYRQHGKNQVGVNFHFKARLNRFKKVKDGWWLSQAKLIATLVGISSHRFIKSWSAMRRRDLLFLATQAFQCRRLFKEKIVFLFFCLMLAIIGVR